MIGQGLQHLLQSPMAGGQQGQFPDPTDIVSQLMGQFEEYVRKRQSGAMSFGASMGQQGFQPPVGTPPREKAGRLRESGVKGATTFLEQAGEEAAESWKPKGLDIALLGASIALPIIAALQPEGRGRRGQRKQQRMGDLFKGLGDIAGQGLQMRMGSFEAGKEAKYGAAKTRAEMALEETGTKYETEIGRIEAAEKGERWEKEFGLAERGMAVKERPEAEKPMFTPGQLYQQGRDVAADARRTQSENQKKILVKANRITRPFFGIEFVVNSIQDLDEAIYDFENPKENSVLVNYPGSQRQIIVQQLKNLRDQYYGGQTPMLPMGGGQTGSGMGEIPLSPEEKAELEARRRR